MSAVKDAITALRDALKLTDDVKQVGESLKSVAQELREHDRRITRLEAKWETAIEIAAIRNGGNSRQIGSPDN
ncbi:hypothetical protein BUE93_22000 [Chromobacterium amazonense]|uniref:Uncharacterized protein n=1 Tax=Chromobacterium amazonense TaxID=1382803 RepID=A0A2S9WYD0_9NEIS|nr:hypothetical protein [Chromobacterium amazonense]PRP68478.1 hypothetical protein BUE93_22000 [Chromobacterium amazonense]